jgi:hypothetical protein
MRIMERDAGGMFPRDLDGALEKARGQCVLAPRAISDLTARLPQAYEALRTRDRSGDDLTSRMGGPRISQRAPLKRSAAGRRGGRLCGMDRVYCRGALPGGSASVSAGVCTRSY